METLRDIRRPAEGCSGPLSETGSRAKTPEERGAVFEFPDAADHRSNELDGYAGGARHVMRLVATDAIEVIGVTLLIHESYNVLIEAGPAAPAVLTTNLH